MTPLTKTLLSGCNMHDPPGYFYRIQMKMERKEPPSCSISHLLLELYLAT